MVLYFFKALHQVALSSLQYNRELKNLTSMKQVRLDVSLAQWCVV